MSNGKIIYTRLSDPKENAFSVEVPTNWRTYGGTFRISPVDVRSSVHTISPDGKIYINIKDENIPTFTRPIGFGPLSIKEGQWYSPAPGAKMLVSRYLPGVEFAEWYLRRFRQEYENIRILEKRDIPEASEAINSQLLRFGIKNKTDSGEVIYKCMKNGEEMNGYCFAQTYDTGNVWIINKLFGYISTPLRENEAHDVLHHMLASMRFNSEWGHQYQNNAIKFSESVRQENAVISDIVKKSHEERMKSYDNITRQVCNMIGDKVEVLDPETGFSGNVDSGHSYYWYNPETNHITWTDTPQCPDSKYRPLIIKN